MRIDLCPETGICSIMKEDGKKVDLIPDEVGQLKQASGDEAQVKGILGKIDGAFADSLTSDEIGEIASAVE